MRKRYRLNRPPLVRFTDEVGACKVDVDNCWAIACYHDGIDPDGPCVVFSDDNPHCAAVDDAVLRWQAARQREHMAAAP